MLLEELMKVFSKPASFIMFARAFPFILAVIVAVIPSSSHSTKSSRTLKFTWRLRLELLTLEGELVSALDGELLSALEGELPVLELTLEGELLSALDGELDSALEGELLSVLDGELDSVLVGSSEPLPPLPPLLFLELLELPVLQRRPVHSSSEALDSGSTLPSSSEDSTFLELLLGFLEELDSLAIMSSSSSFRSSSSRPSLIFSTVAESVTSTHLFSKQAK
jgi:hypothetical protein